MWQWWWMGLLILSHQRRFVSRLIAWERGFGARHPVDVDLNISVFHEPKEKCVISMFPEVHSIESVRMRMKGGGYVERPTWHAVWLARCQIQIIEIIYLLFPTRAVFLPYLYGFCTHFPSLEAGPSAVSNTNEDYRTSSGEGKTACDNMSGSTHRVNTRLILLFNGICTHFAMVWWWWCP